MPDEKPCQTLQNIVRAKPSLDNDRQALPAVLVDHCQDPQGPPVMCTVGHKVIGPDMVPMGWSQPDAGTVVKPQAAPLGLLLRDIQSLLTLVCESTDMVGFRVHWSEIKRPRLIGDRLIDVVEPFECKATVEIGPCIEWIEGDGRGEGMDGFMVLIGGVKKKKPCSNHCSPLVVFTDSLRLMSLERKPGGSSFFNAIPVSRRSGPAYPLAFSLNGSFSTSIYRFSEGR
jgi:hypothetical protein